MSTHTCGICGSKERPLVGMSGDEPVCEPCLGANEAPGAVDDDPHPTAVEAPKRVPTPLGATP